MDTVYNAFAKHYEPEEFDELVTSKNLTVFPRVFVLDNGIAGIIYMCYDNQKLCYLDRLKVSDFKINEFSLMDTRELHKELYFKINLDEKIRQESKMPYRF